MATVGLLVVAAAACQSDTDKFGDDPSFKYGRNTVFRHISNTPHPGRTAEEECDRQVHTTPSPAIEHYDAELALKGCLEGVRVELN